MTDHLILYAILALIIITIIFIVMQSKAKGGLLEQIESLRDQNIKEKEILNNDRLQLQEREAKLNELQDQTFKKVDRVENEIIELDLARKQLDNEREFMRNEYQEKLLTIIGMSKEQAREYYFQLMDERHTNERRKLVEKHIDEIEQTKRREANKILLNAMENLSADITTDSVVTSIEIKSDEIKGRLIGREGRNIKTIENTLGVNLIIDDTPGIISVSCFDPIRREIATRTLEKLLETGRINQVTIEQEAAQITKQVDELILEYGNQALDDFAITGVSNEIVYALGALNFRTSFGQNVLAHSIEAAKIAVKIANELQVDPKLAARATLLHDIGKYDKYETGKPHTEVGKMYAEAGEEPEEVINSIESHHGDVEATNIYSIITTIADRISASRPGSRKFAVQNYIERITKLEEIANGVIGVSKSYALQGGRELRLIVESGAVSDEDLPIITDTIKRQIEDQLAFPGIIKINAIRETRYTADAVKNNNL
ncbi:HDIG domain-containing protein [Mollicutes bacterium LVI A0078]|nr:HDIG domain-containing protein [Mollicutes bacterium LVI A0075]WOO90855.1 HDIG domain-containing protein [Mollicutes bacterium LVI A0078]